MRGPLAGAGTTFDDLGRDFPDERNYQRRSILEGV